jgi:hypothetical protein
MTPLPSQEELASFLDYNPHSGEFHWKPRPDHKFKRLFIGKRADKLRGGGYFCVKLFGRELRAHRLAWKYVNGADPAGEIDHINGDRADNRIANLRDVSRTVNGRNACRWSNNTSGVTGVYYIKADGVWAARIKVDGHSHHLGCFAEKDQAIAARKAAECRFGFHPNHGRAALKRAPT